MTTHKTEPFQPHPWLPTGHLQTGLGLLMPYFKTSGWHSERQLFRISDDTTIAAEVSLQSRPKDRATVVILPGIYGKSGSSVLLAVAHKAYHAGFNVVRLNLPNQGGTAHLTPKYYYVGQSEVVTGSIQVLADMGLTDILLIGISYGGNIGAKAVGELGTKARQHIRGLALLSPAIDPLGSLRLTEQPHNRFYERSMVRHLNRLNLVRSVVDSEHFPYKPERTLRRWIDQHMTDPEPIGWGFQDSDDYLTKCSAMPWMAHIEVPTIIIQAKDDPIVPYQSVVDKAVADNPHITVLLTDKGGHCGFIARRPPEGDLDRHWDQNRAIEFFRALEG